MFRLARRACRVEIRTISAGVSDDTFAGLRGLLLSLFTYLDRGLLSAY